MRIARRGVPALLTSDLLLLNSLLVACVGCHGTGRIELASLNFRAIDVPAGPPPRVDRYDLDCCCWWTTPDGQLWLAMQQQRRFFLNPRLRLEFQLSLRLERPPAGPARDYPLGSEELRARLRFGPWESRFTARTGILALYREPGDRLRGSLRAEVAGVAARLLGGWSRPARYLLLGTFTAVRDEQRGRPIAEATESSGWERAPPAEQAPPPATAPGQQQGQQRTAAQ